MLGNFYSIESALWDTCVKDDFLKTGVNLVFPHNDILLFVYLFGCFSSPKPFLIGKSHFIYILYLDNLYKNSFLTRLCFRIISSNLYNF